MGSRKSSDCVDSATPVGDERDSGVQYVERILLSRQSPDAPALFHLMTKIGWRSFVPPKDDSQGDKLPVYDTRNNLSSIVRFLLGNKVDCHPSCIYHDLRGRIHACSRRHPCSKVSIRIEYIDFPLCEATGKMSAILTNH